MRNRIKTIVMFFVYGLVVWLAYGFVKDLYFWRDDYALIYRLQQGGLFAWPYQGWSLSYWPLYLLFGSNPTGYFNTSIIVYFALCLIVYIFVKQITDDYQTAFLAGLILASGYVGAEMMPMTSVATSSLLYIMGSILLILLYRFSLHSGSKFAWFMVLGLYIFLLSMFTQRAHSIFLFIFMSGLYFAIEKRNFSGFIVKSIIFFVLLLPFYVLPDSSSRGISPIIAYLKGFNVSTLLTLFANMGNFLFSQSIQVKLIHLTGKSELIIAGSLGLILIVFLAYFFLFSRVSANSKKQGFLFACLWLSAIVNYHLYAPEMILYPTQRYLLLGYPFFAALLAIIIKSKLPRLFGLLIIVLLVLIHIHEVSSFKQEMLERSNLAHKFFTELSREVPSVNKKSVFYFDIVNHPPTSNRFWDILRVGIYSTEASLASFYRTKIGDVKIVDNYLDFLQSQKDGYTGYQFFYSIDNKLINTAKITSHNNLLEIPHSWTYRTRVREEETRSVGTNTLLKISTQDYFPSYKPFQMEIEMNSHLLLAEIKKFPYFDNGAITSTVSINFKDRLYKQAMFFYIKERSELAKFVKLSASSQNGNNSPSKAMDFSRDSSWEADKVKWIRDKKATLQIDMPNDREIAQVRWISMHPNRVPISYEYRIAENDDQWKTIYKSDGTRHLANVYVIDSLKKKVSTRHLQMIIYKTSDEDFPGIAEIELLSRDYKIDSNTANFVAKYPFTRIEDTFEALEIMNIMVDYLTLDIYLLSDKYPEADENAKISLPFFVDNSYRTYKFSLSPSGTTLKGFVIKFPNVPLEVTARSLRLRVSD